MEDFEIIDELHVDLVDDNDKEEGMFKNVVIKKEDDKINYKFVKDYVKQVVLKYTGFYFLSLMIIVPFLIFILKGINNNIADLFNVSYNNLVAVINPILLTIFTVSSLFLAIKFTENFRKRITIYDNYTYNKIILVAYLMPIFTSLIAIAKFYSTYKGNVTNYYVGSFLLMHALIIIINSLVITLLRGKIKKLV